MAEEKVLNLEEFTIQTQKNVPHATGELSKILRDISFASKIVNREVNKAGLVDILGEAGHSNETGDDVKKLDIIANDIFIETLSNGGQVAGIASEENEDFIDIENDWNEDARYVVAMDPLDGSSNIDVNVSIGTIFAIYRKISPDGPCTKEDFLQPGTAQVAAGYVIYGSSTMLVYTTGKEVNGFTLDPSIGEYYLSHPDLRMPVDGKTYSINQGNYAHFDEGVQSYVDWCNAVDKEENRPYGLRYIGSMVADFHRNLIKGGIFMYPSSVSAPNGKLRILYECNPMAFVAEAAGGLASTGTGRILEVKPTELHQRVPVYVGSKNMVEKVKEMAFSSAGVK